MWVAKTGREGSWMRPLLWLTKTSSQLSAQRGKEVGSECNLNFGETVGILG